MEIVRRNRAQCHVGLLLRAYKKRKEDKARFNASIVNKYWEWLSLSEEQKKIWENVRDYQVVVSDYTKDGSVLLISYWYCPHRVPIWNICRLCESPMGAMRIDWMG